MGEFTHINAEGRPKMVNVSNKANTERVAVAEGKIKVGQGIVELLKEGTSAKGDVMSTAQIGGIMGAKKTWELIPMCHPLPIDGVDMSLILDEEKKEIRIRAEVRNNWKTGVEMEALTAVSVAALTVYDMCKSVDKSMVIGDICLIEKSGGKSGHYVRVDVDRDTK